MEGKGMTPKEVLSYADKHGAKMVDFKFLDFLGTWQHVSVPIARLTEKSFDEGFNFDGSSIRGWQPINASDMIMKPDPASAVMDPFMKTPTISLICNVHDAVTHEAYSRDPRNIALKAEAYLKSIGIADICYFGPEAEFFIFDNVAFDESANGSFYKIDSEEAWWNSGTTSSQRPNLGHRPNFKQGYFPVSPVDRLQDIRTEMCLALEKVGIEVETQHHEVATAGQCEIDMRFNELTKMGDQLMWFKYVVKNVALQNNKTATFMPKPIFGDNGSGMHCHQSLWKNGRNLFAGDDYGGLSQMALHYLGGILKHAPTLCAFTNPSVNSYKRLVPGYEAPVRLAYSARNRSAAIRIPVTSAEPKAKRLEVRFPDPTANPYLAFAVMLMAGLDGIQNKIHPGQPLDKDIYGLSPEELKDVPNTPHTLADSLKALEKDHDFLMRGGVFTQDVIDTWIEYKIENEVRPSMMRPTPFEFAMYFGA
jgi:glutamine synthetase